MPPQTPAQLPFRSFGSASLKLLAARLKGCLEGGRGITVGGLFWLTEVVSPGVVEETTAWMLAAIVMDLGKVGSLRP